MDPSTPPYHRSDKSRNKSSSRLARIGDKAHQESLRISLDLVSSPTKSLSPSALSLKSPPSLPIRDLLLLSPSPRRRSKTRLTDRLEMAEEFVEPVGLHRRCKGRGAQMGTLASPRNSRRSRRRSELEIREERDTGLADENAKPRKRKNSGRSKKEKLSLVPYVPASSSSPKADEENGGNLDRIGQLITDLIMWKDTSKSTLWFGFGFLCFLSSCFTNGLNLSVFSVVSHLAILYLGVSFISNSICQRNQIKKKSEEKLKEDDILRLAKLILPALNLAISKIRELFSGEPSMTLKVVPFLLLGAEYGHLITLWRLCAIGFFVSFSVPKLYSCYSAQMSHRAECFKLRLMDTWNGCTHKKLVVVSVVTVFWNLSCIKTRILTAFIGLVIFRYFRQHAMQEVEDGEEVGEKEQQQALAAAETEEKEQQQALVVVETEEKEKEQQELVVAETEEKEKKQQQ
ncbi:reticulon-like protein B17 [Neltuma alba]|uniref:reticulon-like protein B17 n=1 Tax=Neltuma alba TaxID=207710 RepID=UPI0010A37E7E|nr:reticulon-like protein B17 [Prosopis alba]